MINHPDHYQGDGGMEAIDAMVGLFGAERVAEWCHLTAFKYLCRLGKKDDTLQEIGKAIWYLNKMRSLLGESTPNSDRNNKGKRERAEGWL